MLVAGGLGSPHADLPNTTERGTLPAAVRDHLGHELQAAYGLLTQAELPQRLLDLITQLDSALSEQGDADAAAFRAGLTGALPGLRAFALSLVANEARADDLVQNTVLKAWAAQNRFAPGTNLMAWLCTIMRNEFYSECRKRKREVEDADGVYAGTLVALPDQEHGVELQQVWAVLAKLPPLMREALLLVGAQGLTYEAAAAVMGCQVGTAKSRVSRARAFLAGSVGVPSRRTSR
jgi:RNA polymerase sigma-70 factor (ECF subfamily)